MPKWLQNVEDKAKCDSNADPVIGYPCTHTRMQKILHFDKLDQNLLHFDALDQNPSDLIGFPAVSSSNAHKRSKRFWISTALIKIF
jgi:hypothetical protein